MSSEKSFPKRTYLQKKRQKKATDQNWDHFFFVLEPTLGQIKYISRQHVPCEFRPHLFCPSVCLPLFYATTENLPIGELTWILGMAQQIRKLWGALSRGL